MPTAEEHNSIHRALAKDEDAYRELYRQHHGRIRAIIAQRAKDHDEIDDLVQVCFIRKFKSLKNFRDDAAFSTWLTRIALNVCITHHQNRRTMLPESVLESESRNLPAPPNAEDELDTKERWDSLLSGIEQLPPRYRNVMWMH